MEDEKIEAVKNWPEPRSVRDIQVSSALPISTNVSSEVSAG